MTLPNGSISEALVADLLDARARTLALVEDLTDEQLVGPRLAIVNPLGWEIGHLAWFQERWVLRRGGEPPVRPDADAFYDSFAVPHDTRWDLPLPSRTETLAFMRAVLERVVEHLRSHEPDAETTYFCRLVTYHEDMHAEAFTYTRQTLGYPPPRLLVSPEPRRREGLAGGPLSGDVEVPGGTFLLGATPDLGFVFDNEKWGHALEVGTLRMARVPVTQAEFAGFVEAGGYLRQEFWTPVGWSWRQNENAEAPVYWKREDGTWLRRAFDAWVPLEPHLPVIHVSRHEAEAYCRWARRRLPTETEWEMAASAEPAAGRSLRETKRRYPWGDEPPAPERAHLDARRMGCVEVGACPGGDGPTGLRQLIGNVWEWTASDFEPYPGFVVDPYKEYSQPWFGGAYKVLRGGCWATRSRLIRNTWRNFYTPDRRDVFAGFRTCAL